MYFGSSCQSAVLPALIRPPVANLHPCLPMKQLLPFPLETTMQVNLFSNFNMGVADLSQSSCSPSLCKRSPGLSVKLLHSQALAHYNGTKHAKKLKALGGLKCKQNVTMGTTPNKPSSKSHDPVLVSTDPEWRGSSARESTRASASRGSVGRKARIASMAGRKARASHVAENSTCEEVGGEVEEERAQGLVDSASCPEAAGETEQERAKRLLYCSLCKVAVNSTSQLEAHSVGTKHKTMLEARAGSGCIKAFPRPGVKGRVAEVSREVTDLQNKVFHCETCDVRVNSETQLKQHISSRRHKDRVAGKPAKPKYSPYNKALRGHSVQPVKMSLKKELGLPLAACLLPGHLAAMAASRVVAGSHFPLFQRQPLPSALLRTAPGPIRTSPSPLLFSPY